MTSRAFVLFAVLSSAVALAQDESRTFASTSAAIPTIEAALRDALVERIKPVGTSSLVFQTDLQGPIEAAFRPETRDHPRGFLAEVAAYRIAEQLGIDNVPPAILRSMERGQIRRRLDPESTANFEDIDGDLLPQQGIVRGAFIYWVPGLLRSDLDSPAGIARWSAWLNPAGPPAVANEATARDLSNMILFDYLIGNRDRWSGGNVRPIENGRVIIRDHNLAFPLTLAESVQARMTQTLERARRFSRRFVERLVAMDRVALTRVLADASAPRGSLLDERQIGAVLARRDAVLSWVGAQLEMHGEAASLPWP